MSDKRKLGWHACKRIFAYALMLRNGISKGEVRDYLLEREWFKVFSRYSFELEPAAFVEPLLEEMIRSGAAEWRNERLLARTAHNVPPVDWYSDVLWPDDWPRVTSA